MDARPPIRRGGRSRSARPGRFVASQWLDVLLGRLSAARLFRAVLQLPQKPPPPAGPYPRAPPAPARPPTCCRKNGSMQPPPAGAMSKEPMPQHKAVTRACSYGPPRPFGRGCRAASRPVRVRIAPFAHYGPSDLPQNRTEQSRAEQNRTVLFRPVPHGRDKSSAPPPLSVLM